MKYLIVGIVVIIIILVWIYILTNIFGLNLTRFEHEHKFLSYLLVCSPSFIFMVICFSILDDDNPEETPKEIEPKTDNPKESDDVIVVTEIQGERKIIKNGKVIYSEKLKADELKVFEKDKN